MGAKFGGGVATKAKTTTTTKKTALATVNKEKKINIKATTTLTSTISATSKNKTKQSNNNNNNKTVKSTTTTTKRTEKNLNKSRFTPLFRSLSPSELYKTVKELKWTRLRGLLVFLLFTLLVVQIVSTATTNWLIFGDSVQTHGLWRMCRQVEYTAGDSGVGCERFNKLAGIIYIVLNRYPFRQDQ